MPWSAALASAPVVDDGELAERFRVFAKDSRTRAPLYAELSERIAADRSIHRLLLHAPAEQRLPVLLFACVHSLLLEDPADELAAHYPNLAAGPRRNRGDAYAAFRRFCARHEPRLARLLETRSTQTNEVGRCALLLPALARVAREVGPLALVDVGASAGLNLILDRFEYRYEPGGRVGGPSQVALYCGTRGAVPVPAEPPPIRGRIGLDRCPVDLADPNETRWLEACVWPDQAERFHRLRAAILLARDDPPQVRTGDAVDDVAAAVDTVAADGHPVVLNTWVLNYLSDQRRAAYVAELDRLGAGRDLSWLFAEMPLLVAGLPVPDDPNVATRTVVSLVRWRGGERTVEHLATAHPHGAWIHWA
jgi:hypothetical protein